MRRTLTDPVFLTVILLAVANQIVEKGFGIFIPLVHSYLDDLLCFPIVMTLGLAMYRYFKPFYKLSVWHIWPVVLIYSVYFEWYLPQTSNAYTADVFDVLMYILGASLFQLTINKNKAVSVDIRQDSLAL